MIYHTPHRILRACTDAIEVLHGSADAMPILHHVLALLLLKRHDKLPPSQQSLSNIARNMNIALAGIERSCAEIEGIGRMVDFRCRRNHDPIDPLQVRKAIACFYELPPHTPYAFARAAEDCVRRYGPTRHLPYNIETLFARMMGIAGGTSILEVRPPTSDSFIALLDEARFTANQFTDSASLKLSLAQDDSFHRLTAQILCSLNNTPLSFLEENDLRVLSEESPLRYDRVLYITENPSMRLGDILRLVADDHGMAIVCIPERAADTVLPPEEREVLIRADVVESIVRIGTMASLPDTENSHHAEAWLVYVLRTKKQMHQRHRILFVNDEAKTQRNGIRVIDEESIEEILSARNLFISSGDSYSAVVHRNKISPSPNGLNPAEYCNKKKHSSGAMSLFGGIPRSEFAILTGALAAHGIDVSGYFIDGGTGYVDFAPALASRSLVRVAVSSAPSLKNQETRLHYTFAHWWYRNELLIALLPATRMELEASFTEALDSVGLLDTTAARALWVRWMNSLRHDYHILSRYGSCDVVEAWLMEIEDKAATSGTALWSQLSRNEERLLDIIAPAIMRRIRTSSTTLQEIEEQQSSLHLHDIEQMVTDMLRRREQELHSSIDSIELQVQAVEERIGVLQKYITEHKLRIAELHKKAKAHPLRHDSKELFDSTLSLQDELAVIIGEMVPAQSELRMLEQRLKPFADLQERREHEQSYIERMTQQLPAALSIARRSITPENATIFVLDMFREHLTELLEERISENRERIIGTLERWWDTYKGDDDINKISYQRIMPQR